MPVATHPTVTITRLRLPRLAQKKTRTARPISAMPPAIAAAYGITAAWGEEVVVTRSFNQATASPDMNIHIHQCRVLTRGLFPVLAALKAWGDRHLAGP